MGPAPLPVFHSSDQASNFHPDWSGNAVSIDNWALIAMRNDEDREFISHSEGFEFAAVNEGMARSDRSYGRRDTTKNTG